MTREEAIEALTSKDVCNPDLILEALDMAIEALKQEPNIDMESEEIKILQKRAYLEGFHEAEKLVKQEPCDNTIARILKRMWNCRGKHTTSIDKVKMEQIIRDELPSVNPKAESEK